MDWPRLSTYAEAHKREEKLIDEKVIQPAVEEEPIVLSDSEKINSETRSLPDNDNESNKSASSRVRRKDSPANRNQSNPHPKLS